MPRKQPCESAEEHACDLRERKSPFVQILRTTPPKTVCPNFYILAHANGCTFEPQCSYCYLKASLWHIDGQRAYTNLPALLAEVRRWIGRDGLESYMLNTGNLSDSLSFEAARPLMGELIELFREAAAGRPHTLLLVTKGGVKECAPLLEREPCANVVVSFSLNHPQACKDYEEGAAPAADRLRAAAKLKQAGWRLRLRVDPMITGYPYEALIPKLRKLAPERLTLGSLRAEPHLIKTLGEEIFAELEPAADPKGVARYPEKNRIALYCTLVEPLRDLCPLALCEETETVWKKLGLDTVAMPCNCGV